MAIITYLDILSHLSIYTKSSLGDLLDETGIMDLSIYKYNLTSWLPWSFMQWIKKSKVALNTAKLTWCPIVCYFDGCFIVKLAIGEDIFGIFV